MNRSLSLVVVALIAAVFAVAPTAAGAQVEPTLTCRIQTFDDFVRFSVTTTGLPEKTKIPINMSRIDENGEEVFIFFGTERLLERDITSTGETNEGVPFIGAAFNVRIPESVESGTFDFFARYRLPTGEKGTRVLCGTNDFDAESPVPDGTFGNVLADDQPARCWVADYDQDTSGVQTFVSTTGDIGGTQNFRGDGTWLRTGGSSSDAIASNVDTVILRGGRIGGPQTLDCVRGWTGDVEIPAAEPGTFFPRTVELVTDALVTYEGDEYLFWKIERRWEECRPCSEDLTYVTNLSTGVATLIRSADTTIASTHSCDGRFVGHLIIGDDFRDATIYDIKTGSNVLLLGPPRSSSIGGGGFDCAGSFWFRGGEQVVLPE